MSTLSQFGGLRSTRSIVNGCSTSGYTPFGNCTGTNARQILSGSLTANTLKTLLTVSGGGEFHFLTVTSRDATSRTLRARLTLDGVVVFDSTSAAFTTATIGAVLVGAYSGGNAFVVAPGVVRFNNSAVVEVASSLTEVDMLQLNYILAGA
jgi:hypothetical protein